MNYEDIFRERGGAYDRAMRHWPDARRDEFLLPLQRAGVVGGETVIDVPAGGGYLQRYLPSNCAWHGHEPSASFLDVAGGDANLLPLPWPDCFADVAVSIAGLHHIADKRPLFNELYRVLSPRGRFVLADAHRSSAVARFLDEFVGQYNSTGHEGDYLDDTIVDDLRSAGFDVSDARRTAYCWWFADRRQMAEFCHLLFDIRGVDHGTVVDAIEHYLGVTQRNGAVGMNWELLIASGTRPATE
jgi:SAM-dependent methyltransferase